MTTDNPLETESNGTLITLEGIDGSGKTSAWEHLEDTLPDVLDETSIKFTREPTQDTFYGEAVYESLGTDDADSLAELFLYLADHAAHLTETIRPALNDNTAVISDRYSDSRCAYQAATLAEYTHLSIKDTLAWIRNLHQPWTRTPDLTIYLDVPPEISVERSAKANKFEQLDHLETVAANYDHIISKNTGRFLRIDATQDQETVADQVETAVTEFLNA